MVYFIYAIKIGKLERTIQNDSIVLCLKLTGHKKKMNPHITSFSLPLL